MTAILVRKLLRDVRPALVVVCLILFAFAAFWVKIAQRVTAEIAPVFSTVGKIFEEVRQPGEEGGKAKNVFEDVLFKGPGKVSQAALGWGDLNFERPNDFLAMGMLHPVVLTLCVVWGVGRAAGAVAGEIDRGTMELLMSQPVPRSRLILAHFVVDLIVLPVICLSFFLGTQFGLAVVGDFVPDYTTLRNLKGPGAEFLREKLPTDDSPLPVDGTSELYGLVNTLALLFAVSGMTMAISAAGRSRWKATGYAVLVVVLMFVANTIGQLWEPVGWVRPLTFFFYYQPQRAMLDADWMADLGKAWPGMPPVSGPGVLFAVGAVGYLLALRTFTRRDLPAPL
jgi:ABC-2 type transport system permease protein